MALGNRKTALIVAALAFVALLVLYLRGWKNRTEGYSKSWTYGDIGLGPVPVKPLMKPKGKYIPLPARWVDTKRRTKTQTIWDTAESKPYFYRTGGVQSNGKPYPPRIMPNDKSWASRDS